MRKVSAISPGINAMMASPEAGGDQATALFEQAFSDMSYQTLQGKMPELLDSVVTFRLLLSDIQSGHAVGSFVVSRKGQIVYIPSVLIDNAVKPLDLFYAKDLGKFLPLTDKWIEEVDKVNPTEMGFATRKPATVPSDISLRNQLIPPYAGRYGYASILEEMLASEDKEKIASEVKSTIKEILKKAGYGYGEQLMNKFLANRKIAEVVLNQFDGPEKLAEYFCVQQKPETVIPSTVIEVVKRDAPLSKFAEVFEDKADEAFQEALQKGYAVKISSDYRLHGTVLKDNVREPQTVEEVTEPAQSFLYIEDPADSGFHRLYRADGKAEEALVISTHGHIKKHVVDFVDQLIIFGNGEYTHASKICGTPLTAIEIEKSPIYKKLREDTKTSAISKGKCIFLRSTGADKLEVCGPFEIEQTLSKGKEVRAKTFDNKIIVIAPTKVGKVINFKDSNIIYIPDDFTYIPLKKERTVEFFSRPNDVYKAFSRGIFNQAEDEIKLKYAEGFFNLNGSEGDEADTVARLVGTHKLSLKCAEDLIADAIEGFNVRAAVISESTINKLASIFDPVVEQPSMDPSMGGGMPMDPSMGGGMPMDPSMGGGMPMDPSMDPMAAGGMGMASGENLEIPEINPAFAQDPSVLSDPEILDMAALDVIIKSPTLRDIISEYSGDFLKSLDYIGRVLLAIYVKAPELKDELGNIQFSSLENTTRNLFKSFGEALIDFHQNSSILGQSVQSDYEQAE